MKLRDNRDNLSRILLKRIIQYINHAGISQIDNR